MPDAVTITAQPITQSSPTAQPLSEADWQALEQQHQQRADELTATYRDYRAAGRKHAIDDFLFTYYSYKPAVLRRWHPGIGRSLEDAPCLAGQALVPGGCLRWRRCGCGSLPGCEG